MNPVTKAELIEAIDSAMASGIRNGIIGNHNLHSVYLFHQYPEMQEFYRSTFLTHIDGMSLVLLGRAFGAPLRRCHRTGYLDWFAEFLHLAERRKWRIYFVGGRPEAATKLPARIRRDFPDLQFSCHHGYDAFTSTTTIYEEIASFRPDIVLVGMGMPLQEKWLLQAREKTSVRLFFQCGAIMDYLVGEQRPCPRWLGQLGFEWIFRLMCRPGPLAYRYLVEPFKLAPIVARELRNRSLELDSEQ